MFRVIEYFEDLQDNNRPYNVGDIFPYDNREISTERLAELSTAQNRRKMPLIKEVEQAHETVVRKNNKGKKTAKKAENKE